MTGASKQTTATRNKRAMKSKEKLPINKAQLQKYLDANRVVIKHPRMAKALKRVEDCRQMSKGAREPECMLIIGEPGVGKTTIKDHYLSLNPREETERGTRVPVLAATIPIPAKISSIATSLLAALGDPAPHRGSLDMRTRRLYRLIKECEVELIFLDEFHHFIDSEKDIVLRLVSDWLKNLISDTKVPVILTGLPSSRKVLEANEQLHRRFSCQLNLSTFSYHAKRRTELKRFLGELQKSLPVDCNIDFSEDDIAQRFFSATAGRVSGLIKVAKGASFIATTRGDKFITQETLAEAYEKRLLLADDKRKRIDPERNPFDPQWTPKQKFSKPGKSPASLDVAGMSKTELKNTMSDVFRP